MKFYEGLPETVGSSVVRTAVEQALEGCKCYDATEELARLLMISHGKPSAHAVEKQLQIAREHLESSGEYYSTIRGTKCEIPLGVSTLDYIGEVLKKDWVKAHEMLDRSTEDIRRYAGERGGGACSTLRLLVKALEMR